MPFPIAVLAFVARIGKITHRSRSLAKFGNGSCHSHASRNRKPVSAWHEWIPPSSVRTEPVRSTATEGGMALMRAPHRTVSGDSALCHGPTLCQGQAHGHTTDAGGPAALGTLGGRGRAGRTVIPARRLRDRLARSPLHPRGGKDPDPGHAERALLAAARGAAISPACATFPRMPRASRSSPRPPPTVPTGF